MATDFDCCLNGEHDAPAEPALSSADYLASLTDDQLTTIATDRLQVWRALIDAAEFDAAEGLEHLIQEVHREVERRLTQLQAESTALAAFLNGPASPMRGTL